MDNCLHEKLYCINEYELIRKYCCNDCDKVMMCSCDKEIALKFLPHQIYTGTSSDTRESIPVTSGFIENICNECRNLKPIPSPLASVPKRTSKIKRYYWRELTFREMRLFESYGGNPEKYIYYDTSLENKELINKAKTEALEDIKILHREIEKYTYNETSSAKIIEDYSIEIVNLYAEYIGSENRKAQIEYRNKIYTVEDYVKAILNEQGYEVLFLESSPIHVLFSVFMWILIQDSSDNKVDLVGFGDRIAFERKQQPQTIWTYLPSDFGSKSYSDSRKTQIGKHFEEIISHGEDLLWLFDYWLPYSTELRQYLWAYQKEHINKARTLVETLPPSKTISILKYLLESYWERYLGWPDLLAYKEDEYVFIEVKSSKDKLSEEQKLWIKGNFEYLDLPFKIFKVHQLSNQNKK